MLTPAIQAKLGPHAGSVGVLQPLLTLVLAAAGGGLLVMALDRVVPRTRRALHSRLARLRRRRRRRRAAESMELRARAMMDELCPHGWQAQITLLGRSDEELPDLPYGRRDRVVLDWTAFEADRSRDPVIRRVVAPTINEALEAMIAGRRTDETLERIEQTALAEGDQWPDQ